MPLFLLTLALLVLIAGPLVARAFASHAGATRAVDGFVVTTIAGLVLLEALPGALVRRDLAVFALLALGVLLPPLVERLFRSAAQQTHRALLALAVAGICVHSALDGGVLALAGGESGSLLGLGVVLHQLPVGLTIWWVLRERPSSAAWLVLGLMSLATIAGFVASESVLSFVSADGVALGQAFIGGSLLHIVAHPLHNTASAESGHPWLEGAGALAGLTLLGVLLAGGRFADAEGFLSATGSVFWQLALESAPAVLLAYVAVGLFRALAPASSLTWLGRGRPLTQACKGMVVGLPLPICSCGVVPIYEGLVRAGVPATAALAFLVATPELGFDAILLTLPLLGLQFTVVRLVAAAAVAVLVSLVVGRMIARAPSRRVLPQAGAGPLAAERGGWRSVVDGMRDSVDSTAPWLLIGLLVAALLAPLLERADLAVIPAWIQLPAFALLGLPMYVCASAATPLVAVLIAAGVSPGAGLAFLLTGPATNVTTAGMMTRLHGGRAAAVFMGTMFALSLSAGFAVNLVLPRLTLPLATGLGAEDAPSMLRLVALLLVVLLFAGSLLRRGPRAFVGELRLGAAGHSHDEHGHEHHHHHSHHHHHAPAPARDESRLRPPLAADASPLIRAD